VTDARARRDRAPIGEPALEVNVPGWNKLSIRHLVLDINGTLSTDGQVLPGVEARIGQLATLVECHIVTAETSANATAVASTLHCRLHVVRSSAQDNQKATYVRSLGSTTVVTVGNGANDAHMLREAALGICVLGDEGAAASALLAADVVCPSILTALDLLRHPQRLVATLRR
jgi:P-type E1-E2 ATPase